MRLAAGLAVCLAAPTAAAQGFASAVQHPRDLFVTPSAWVSSHLRVGGVLTVAHLRDDPGAGAHATGAAGAVHLGLGDRAQLGVGVPWVFDGATPRSVTAEGRLRLLGLHRGGFGRMGVLVRASLGLGGAPSALGARWLVTLNNAREYQFVASLGVDWRGSAGLALEAAVGVTLPVVARVMVTVEATGAAPGEALARGTLHGLAGLRWLSEAGVMLGAAGGPRIAGEGPPSALFMLQGGYAVPVRVAERVVGDGDGDLVLDPDDRCPDEPAGSRPDRRRRGCPMHDRDDDGVEDARDACPEVPQGLSPDPERLGCPTRDVDGDGIPDARDACPTVPEGATPDPARPGCPDPDRDRDGIANDDDACPDLYGRATRDPRTHGCPNVALTRDEIVIREQPRFRIDRAEIMPESERLLLEVRAVLEVHPELERVEVQGHTDDRADEPHNLNLSQRRAEAVRRWLVEHGIAASRLEARGYGESQPLQSNRTEAGRAANRRVAFVIRLRAASAQE